MPYNELSWLRTAFTVCYSELLTALTMRYGEYTMLVADCRHCALQWVVANWLWTALTMHYSELWYGYLLCTTACFLLYKVVGKLTTRPGGGAGHTACQAGVSLLFPLHEIFHPLPACKREGSTNWGRDSSVPATSPQGALNGSSRLLHNILNSSTVA